MVCMRVNVDGINVHAVVSFHKGQEVPPDLLVLERRQATTAWLSHLHVTLWPCPHVAQARTMGSISFSAMGNPR